MDQPFVDKVCVTTQKLYSQFFLGCPCTVHCTIHYSLRFRTLTCNFQGRMGCSRNYQGRAVGGGGVNFIFQGGVVERTCSSNQGLVSTTTHMISPIYKNFKQLGPVVHVLLQSKRKISFFFFPLVLQRSAILNLLSKIQEFLSKKFCQVPKPSGTHKNK